MDDHDKVLEDDLQEPPATRETWNADSDVHERYVPPLISVLTPTSSIVAHAHTAPLLVSQYHHQIYCDPPAAEFALPPSKFHTSGSGRSLARNLTHSRLLNSDHLIPRWIIPPLERSSNPCYRVNHPGSKRHYPGS